MGPKTNGTFRIVSQNIDNLGVDPRSAKSHEVTEMICSDDADIWLLQEVGINWRNMKQLELWEERCKIRGNTRTSATWAYNTHDVSRTKFQPGGTGVIVKNKTIGKQEARGDDPRHLGRWAWVSLKGRQGKEVVVVSGYRPVTHQNVGVNTVHDQQTRTLSTSDIHDPPREVFLTDLASVIKEWHSKGKMVILGMDANQNVLSTRMKDFANECELIEVISETRQGLPKVSTCLKNHNNTPIDGIWASASLQVESAGYCDAGDKVSSDHLALWADFAFTTILGKEDTTVNPSVRSLLNVKNHRVTQKYTRAVTTMQKKVKLLQTLQQLDSKRTEEWDANDEVEFNNVIKYDSTMRRQIVANIRTTYTGALPWSPKLQQLRDERRLWFLIIKLRSGCVVKSQQIRRLQKKVNIEDAFEVSLAEAKNRKAAVDQSMKKSDTEWQQARYEFLKQLDRQNAIVKGTKPFKERKSRVGIERQRKIGRIISRIKGKKKVTISNLIVRDENGAVQELGTVKEMEDACIKSNVRRFTQANHCEAVSGHWVSRIGYLAEKDGAHEILHGSFEADGMSRYMKELLDEMRHQGTGTNISALTTISKEEHQYAWAKQKAQTGSDSRGLSYSHFKVSALDDNIAEVDRLVRQIPYQQGFSPLLWQQVTDFQLLKKAGVFDVDLMRTIQLYMAEFNMNNKKLGRDVLRQAEQMGYLPEELTGSRKNRMASTTILNKVLLNDLWRLRRIAAALASTDAKSCYDRVIHWVAIMAMRCIDFPYEPLRSMFLTIQKAVHSIALEDNISRTYYSGQDFDPPLHGLGQGNGAAPAVWVMVSASIINMMRRRGHGVQLVSAISQLAMTTAGFMFVDDLDLVDSAVSPWSDGKDAVCRLQASIDRWVGGLRASGGKLVPEKSYWYYIDFKWKLDRWVYVEPSASVTLRIDDEEGQSCALQRLHPSQARETLGIYTAMDGNSRDQLNKFQTLTKKIASRFRNSTASATEIWEIFRSTVMKTWDYPKTAIQLSKPEWDSVIRLILPTILNKATIAKTFPSLLVFSPLKYHGLGLQHPWWDQNIKHLRSLLYEMVNASTTGQLMRQTIEQIKLEIGLPGPLREMPWLRLSSYVTSCWISHLFQFATEANIAVYEPTPDLSLRRQHDVSIMQLALDNGFTGTQLRRINNTRQFLQVSFLSQITNLAGTCIERQYWKGTHPPSHHWDLRWPRAAIPKLNDLKLWRRLLSHVTRSPMSMRLRQHLGRWTSSPTIKWWHSCQTDRLYKRVHAWREEWARSPSGLFRPVRDDRLTGALPVDASPVDVEVFEHGVRFTSLTISLEVPARQSPEWWQDPRLVRSWQLHHTREAVVEALVTDSMLIVSDGSKKESHGTSAFTVARRASDGYLATGDAIVVGRCDKMSPYRAELFGVLSAMAWCEHIAHSVGCQGHAVQCACDNSTVIRHAQETGPLRPEWADWDLLQSLRMALAQSRLKWSFFWVRGHQDVTGRKLTQPEAMNVHSDHLAKDCWEATVAENNETRVPSLESESCGIFLGNTKLTQFVEEEIYEFAACQDIKRHWQHRHSLTQEQWELIDWDVLGRAMKSIPPEVRRWTSKHWSGFSATGKVLQRRGEWTESVCPVCSLHEEDAEHAWFCPDARIRSKWVQLQADTDVHLQKIGTSPSLSKVILALFPPWSDRPPTISFGNEEATSLMAAQTTIGIPQLFRGRMAKSWVDHQQRWLLAQATRWKRSSVRWASRLLHHLLLTAWNVWRFRTELLHDPEHPWQQAQLLQAKQSITRYINQPTLFLASDQTMLQNLSKILPHLNLEQAQHSLQSLSAAQLRKQAYERSLQGPRALLHSWLNKSAPT